MKKTHYINNSRFEELVLLYCDNKISQPEEDELVTMFYTLIEKVLVSFNFRLELEDTKQDCFVVILRILENFNRDNGKAFNYFTTVILNHLRCLYTKDKKNDEKLQKYIEMNKERIEAEWDSFSD